MQLILIADIIAAHELRIILKEFQRGDLRVFKTFKIQRVQKFSIIARCNVIKPQALSLLPQAQIGTRELVHPCSDYIIRIK